MRRGNSFTALLGLIVASVTIAGCYAGGTIDYADTAQGPAELTFPAPTVLGMTKTANASTQPGSITIFLDLSEAMESAPSVTSEVLVGDVPFASVSKSTEVDECSLIEGNRVSCEMDVAGCYYPTDYRVTIAGGVSERGVEMEPFEMRLSSSDSEFRSLDEANLCFTKWMGDGSEGDPSFWDVAELALVGDTLQWEFIGNINDLSEGSLYKDLYGYLDVAVTMKVVGVPDDLMTRFSDLVGMGMQPTYASQSDFYRLLMTAGIPMTTYTDDATYSVYLQNLYGLDDISTHYLCMVKRVTEIKYYMSVDGRNFFEIDSSNTTRIDGPECNTGTPVDANWECPSNPASLCDPDADWGGDCDGTYEECVADVEDTFNDEICSTLFDPQTLELAYATLSPKVSFYARGREGGSSNRIDWIRWKVVGLAGDASDCSIEY